METITLRADLQTTLTASASLEDKSINELVNEAVERYLLQRQLTKIDTEIESYRRLHPMLRQAHFGQWVAVHEQQLVDFDIDRAALYQRVRQKYGLRPVLIRQVAEQPEEDLMVRTPSDGRRVE
jgi:hypothetical protein